MFITLMYHLIDDVLVDPMCISRRQLRDQLTTLRRLGVQLLTLSQALGRLKARDAAPAALLTFDDGYRNSLDVALPMLEAFAAPALLAVCSSYLSPELPPESAVHVTQDFADVAGVRRWLDSGRDIAGHSHTHPKLTRLSDEEVTWQVAEDQLLLKQAFGSAPRAFVYPFGSVDERVSKLVSGIYEAAFTDERGTHPGAGSDWMLRRVRVRPEWSQDDFEQVILSELSACIGPEQHKVEGQ